MSGPLFNAPFRKHLSNYALRLQSSLTGRIRLYMDEQDASDLEHGVMTTVSTSRLNVCNLIP